jgi:hypothetical protein
VSVDLQAAPRATCSPLTFTPARART